MFKKVVYKLVCALLSGILFSLAGLLMALLFSGLLFVVFLCWEALGILSHDTAVGVFSWLAAGLIGIIGPGLGLMGGLIHGWIHSEESWQRQQQ